jgi:hypothetical protein
MRCASSALLALLAWLAVSHVARAQDALGKGADFSDDWDAILNLAPPPATVAANDGRRNRTARTAATETRRASVQDLGANQGESSARGERRARREAERAAAEARRAERRQGRASEESARRDRRNDAGSLTSASTDKRERRGKAESVAAPGLPPGGYESLAASWHAPWPDKDAQKLAAQARSAPALSLHPVGRNQTPYVLIPQGPEGGFDDSQIEVASKAFGSWEGGPRVSARLLDLIYHAAKHFDVYHVHLVSGVRRDRSGSRHSHGLAADIVLPGVSDDELAAYFRPQGFCGVGIYTRADFVHIDVRERSYFWLDKSPPGRRTRIIPVRGEEALAADEAAVARGQTGYVNPPRLQKALHTRRKQRLAQAKLAQ